MFVNHEISLNATGHGLDLGDKVRGHVTIDVDDPEKADRIRQVYQDADQAALAILQEPPKQS